MDFQTVIDNAVQAKRNEELANSSQLLLGELILKCEAVNNKQLPIYFDDTEYRPRGVSSWRGIYRELMLDYKQAGSFSTDEIEHEYPDDPEYNSYKQQTTELSENVTAKELLEMLKLCQGKTFVGYKGGDFLMGKNTPVWVSTYGKCDGFITNDSYDSQAVVNVTETPEKVIINTQLMAS